MAIMVEQIVNDRRGEELGSSLSSAYVPTSLSVRFLIISSGGKLTTRVCFFPSFAILLKKSVFAFHLYKDEKE